MNKKKLNIVVEYIGTNYVVNDLGARKSPRFELYDKAKKKTIKKSNDPLSFDNLIYGDN